MRGIFVLGCALVVLAVPAAVMGQDVCWEIWQPVCGCDGRTYSNSCWAAISGVQVIYQGECDFPAFGDLPLKDADQDGYFDDARACDNLDCDDAAPSVYPGAAEVFRDGVDQDCDGYDLTISILEATCVGSKLYVEADSLYGQAATLVVYSYGPMTWDKRSSRWVLKGKAESCPQFVFVLGREGIAAGQVTILDRKK